MNEPSPPPAASQGGAYASPTERVKAWLEGPVLHIRFNNPAKQTALSVDMWEAIPPLLARAGGDDEVVVGDGLAVSGAEAAGVGVEGGDGVSDPGDAPGDEVGLVAFGVLRLENAAAHEGPEGLIVVLGRGLDEGDVK